jgi:hypothetical protein
MRTYLLFCSLLIIISSCNQNNSLTQNADSTILQNRVIDRATNKQYILDTSKIAIILTDSSFKNTISSKLTEQDLKNIESLLELAIKKYNNPGPLKSSPSNKIQLEDYKRQYIPHINSEGDKIVSIQCFCKEMDKSDYWKSNLKIIHDGGSCVFGLEINLTKGNYTEVSVHGSA